MIVKTRASDAVSVPDFSTFEKNKLCKGIHKILRVVYYDVLIAIIGNFSIDW